MVEGLTVILSFILTVPLWMPIYAMASTVYDVGPGQAHTELSTIDWPGLQAGERVRIRGGDVGHPET